jgi:hypothetical protein
VSGLAVRRARLTTGMLHGGRQLPNEPHTCRAVTAARTVLAATNKCLAKSNKSHTRDKATKRRFRQMKRYPPPYACCPKTTSQNHDAPGSQIDRAPSRLTLRTVRFGDFRVNFRDGNETTAYYTDDLEDAVNTVVEMARKRGQSPC